MQRIGVLIDRFGDAHSNEMPEFAVVNGPGTDMRMRQPETILDELDALEATTHAIGRRHPRCAPDRGRAPPALTSRGGAPFDRATDCAVVIIKKLMGEPVNAESDRFSGAMMWHATTLAKVNEVNDKDRLARHKHKTG